MIRAFEKFIEEKNLCHKADKILLAVSGGADSVVMLDLFHNAGYKPAIAHCNFKLRGEESDADEISVKKLAEKYRTQSFYKSFETKKFAEENKLSVQEAARELRYTWFEDLARKNNFTKIAVAHHLDDQTETFFINLFRGAGLKGLKGIPVKRGKIIRPLLFASRKEIEAYAEKNKLIFRNDSSNDSDKYLRNKIRHHLLPQIYELKPGFRESLHSSFDLLKEDNQVLELLLNEKRNQLFLSEKDKTKVEISSLIDFTPALLFYFFSSVGINRSVSDSLFKSLQKGESGKQFETPSHRLLIDRTSLIIKQRERETESTEYSIYENMEKLTEPVQLRFKRIENNQHFKIEKSKAVACFDLDKLTFPLELRKWKNGDRFVPFGMKGSKLVSDFLTDEKVNLFDKENVWVLRSANEIIWIVGYRASDVFKIKTTTKLILQAKLLA